MKVLVAHGFECGSKMAHVLNTIKMAQGFAQNGHEVMLICRNRPDGISIEEMLSAFGIKENINVCLMPNKCGEHWKFALRALPAIIRYKPNLVYARSYIFPWLTSRLGYSTSGESHAHPDNRTPHFLRYVKGTHHTAFRCWVTISQHLADHYQSLGVDHRKLIVLPDGVDLELFTQPERLPASPYLENGPNIVYSGHLYDYKGIPTILGAAKLLPDFSFHLIGGLPKDLNRVKKHISDIGLSNVIAHGFKSHVDVPPYLWHANVLLLPPSSKHPSAKWTSPMKLGEYLAARRPVIVTDIPALRTWVTDDEVWFTKPDDSTSLAKTIQECLHSYDVNKIQKSYALAKQMSYKIRAKQITEVCFKEI